MSYKQKFYERYVSTHIVHRKGAVTLEEFRQRAIYFQKKWRSFFPNNKDSKILDIGCGNGGLVWWLQSTGYLQAQGIDIRTEQVAEADRLGVKNIYVADLKHFVADKHNYYDVLILRDVIEHFTKEEILDILALCLDALKPEGRIIIQVPNAEAPFFGRIRYGDFTHELAFSMSSLQQLLQVMGFTEIRTYPTEPAFTNLKSLARLGLWKFVERFYKLLLFAELGQGQRIVTQGIIAVGSKPNPLQSLI